MRRVALVPRPDLLPQPDNEVKRVILYETDNGTYVFPSRSTEDTGSFADEWYESVADAYRACREQFGIEEPMWRDVPDPEPYCQHDWIAPVRVRGREHGRPEWGVVERRVNGVWVRHTDKGK